jgi:hypothetical protein
MYWGCSNRLVVVSVIHEHGTKVANNVDDEEDGAILALHREVATTGIARHWLDCRKLVQTFVNDLGRAKNIAARICRECKCQENDEQDDRVHVVGQKRGLDPTKHGVHHDAERKEKASCSSRYASQGRDDGRSSGKQHGSDERVGEQAEGDVDEMRRGSIAGFNSFEECLVWCQ